MSDFGWITSELFVSFKVFAGNFLFSKTVFPMVIEGRCRVGTFEKAKIPLTIESNECALAYLK